MYMGMVYVQDSVEVPGSGIFDLPDPDPVLFLPNPTPNYLFIGKIAYIPSKMHK